MPANNQHEFKSNYGVGILALIGLLGFFMGCVILFYDSMFNDGKSTFHEIAYNPKVMVKNTLEKFDKRLQDSINPRKQIIKSIDSVRSLYNKDTVKLKAAIKILKDANKNFETDTAKLNTNNKLFEDKRKSFEKYIAESRSIDVDYDTALFKDLNKVLHFRIGPDTLNAWEKKFDTAHYTPDDTTTIGFVHYTYKDPTTKIDELIADSTKFHIVNARSNMAFITKYPSAGMWVLMILVFCSFCFIGITVCFDLIKKAKAIFSNTNFANAKTPNYLLISFLSLLCLVLFIVSWVITFYDGEVVKNIFFMRHLVCSVYAVLVLGCIAGSLCLAGFIYTAYLLNFFVSNLKVNAKAIEAMKVTKMAADVGLAAADVQVDPEIAEMQRQQDELQKLYNRLSAVFRSYFMIVATILSLTVLCTGALFNTVNSLDFMKLISYDWGYTPLRGDFVYFYGALFTIVLLLVYIPAKIKFAEFNTSKTADPAAAVADNSGLLGALKDPFSKLKDTLVVVSPLLVSVVQSLLDFLFK